jgi:hypothetical protein
MRCEKTPKIWEFDNGRYTACGCWESKYDHWFVAAESIVSVLKREGNALNYDSDALRKNWNHYNLTGEILFDKPIGGRSDGRW